MTDKNSARVRKKKDLFLEALARVGTVTHAAEAAGVSRSQLYRWREQDRAFAEDWEVALERSADVLEDEACRRALLGVETPVFHRGKVAGTVQKYSDNLLMFLLKARRPQRFRDHHSIEVHEKKYNPLVDRQASRFRELLVAALTPFPEARIRLAKVLGALPPNSELPEITREFLVAHGVVDEETAKSIDLPALPSTTGGATGSESPPAAPAKKE